MKTIYISFLQMIRQMKNSAMLVVITLTPLLAGVVFRYVIPAAEKMITEYSGKDAILKPYYVLLDIFLIMLTPAMFQYVAAMVMLEEADDHIAAYLAVTPLGRTGYLLSRLGITSLVSLPVSIISALLFHLSQMNTFTFLWIALAGTAQGVIAALLIVSLSANKVEGMAVGKFTSLLSVGVVIPYFVDGKAQFFAVPLPSFWVGKAIQTGIYSLFLISILSALIWILLLSRRFGRKITG